MICFVDIDDNFVILSILFCEGIGFEHRRHVFMFQKEMEKLEVNVAASSPTIIQGSGLYRC